MLKILLVNPSKRLIHHPPLGLGYLSSYVKKYLKVPVEIRLFDENTTREDLLKIVTVFRPDLIGISIVTPTFQHAVRISASAYKLQRKALSLLEGCT